MDNADDDEKPFGRTRVEGDSSGLFQVPVRTGTRDMAGGKAMPSQSLGRGCWGCVSGERKTERGPKKIAAEAKGTRAREDGEGGGPLGARGTCKASGAGDDV